MNEKKIRIVLMVISAILLIADVLIFIGFQKHLKIDFLRNIMAIVCLILGIIAVLVFITCLIKLIKFKQ